MKTGILPKGKLHIARLVDGVINELIVDLGNEQEITASQKIIISTIRQNLIFLALVNEWIAQQPGIVNEKGEMLGPLNGFYLAAQGAVVRACRDLGLKRVSPADDLESYLARNYGKTKDSPATAIGSGKPLTTKTARKRSSIVEASGEVKEND